MKNFPQETCPKEPFSNNTIPKEFLNKIAQIIFDKKGFNIIVLDVIGLSSITNYMVIAEGNVDKHIKALASAVITTLKKEKKIVPYKVEGKSNGDWIVIDYQDVMIHLFMPYLREKYQLEQLWPEGKIIDVEIDIKTKNSGNYDE